MTQRNRWTRTTIGALTLVLSSGIASPLAWAELAPRAAQATPIARAAAAKGAKLGDARAAEAPAAATPSPTESRPFFKTPKGAAAIILMAGVTAYTIHSRICCALHSPAR